MHKHIIRWLPAFLLMAAIFLFSSIPSYEMPHFAWADLLVKKGGHALGYGLLALLYARGLRPDARPESAPVRRRRYLAAFLLAVTYSALDEFHQSFTPGRHPSPWDVLIDSCGAALALFCWTTQ